MADVRPFRALRPKNDLAAEVIAPPYDVLSEGEARAIAQNRRSFVRVTRSEVDLPEGADAHGAEAYQKARENLDAFLAEGTLVEDDEPRLYFYGQVMGPHRQVGVIGAASVAEYDNGKIKRHEHTRPDKEDDRTRHMEALDAQVGLVFLAHAPDAALRALTASATAREPEWRVKTEDGVEHALWVATASDTEALRARFGEMPALYVCDGHHRSAAASRVHAARQNDATAHFLAGIYPADQLQVMAYNRLVLDWNGVYAGKFLHDLEDLFEVEQVPDGHPRRRGNFCCYVGGAWYGARARPGLVDLADPVGSLDVAVLQDNILGPMLGIDDPRTSERIKFVGGIRGTAVLSEAVDKGEAAVAFSMYPTGLDQLFSVADAGHVMPPKSTWFEPKLREGVVSKRLVPAP